MRLSRIGIYASLVCPWLLHRLDSFLVEGDWDWNNDKLDVDDQLEWLANEAVNSHSDAMLGPVLCIRLIKTILGSQIMIAQPFGPTLPSLKVSRANCPA